MAGRLGFGMSGTINGTDHFAAAMTNFGEAHQATQSAMSNLTNSNATLALTLPALQQNMAQQGQVLAMLCQQVNNAWQGNNNNWNNNNNGSSNNNNRSNNGGSRCNNRGRNNNNNSRNGKRNGGGDGDHPWNVRQFEGTTYCWSHGHDTGPHHTSVTCTNRAQGHQAAATSTNTMGGNPKNAERTTNRCQVCRIGRA